MNDECEAETESTILGELSELGSAIKPLLRRLPVAKKAITLLTDGLGPGAKALRSRLHLYTTENLVKEARRVADVTGLPPPAVFDNLVRQRRIDELTMDAIRHVNENADMHEKDTVDTTGKAESTTDGWFHTYYEEAGAVEEEHVREAFMRILAGEMQTPGSFSARTLRVLSAVTQSTAQHFRRAASASIQLTINGNHIIDARIPAIGGTLGQNCLKNVSLHYDVLIDLTEHGLLHSNYGSNHPYGPFDVPFNSQSPQARLAQIPFIHQGRSWQLIPKTDSKVAKSIMVSGAKLTSCGVELLKIVDIEDIPTFTDKLVGHFSQSGYQMVPSQ